MFCLPKKPIRNSRRLSVKTSTFQCLLVQRGNSKTSRIYSVEFFKEQISPEASTYRGDLDEGKIVTLVTDVIDFVTADTILIKKHCFKTWIWLWFLIDTEWPRLLENNVPEI